MTGIVTITCRLGVHGVLAEHCPTGKLATVYATPEDTGIQGNKTMNTKNKTKRDKRTAMYKHGKIIAYTKAVQYETMEVLKALDIK